MSPRNGVARKLGQVSARKEGAAAVDDALARLEQEAYARQPELNAQNLGWLGSIFGAKANAATNIAGLSTAFAGVIAVICVGDILYLLNTQGAPAMSIVSAPTSIATLALGYMFGKAGK